jgi:membrane-associated phospholipid phosphatase
MRGRARPWTLALAFAASVSSATALEAQEAVHPWELAGESIVETFAFPEILFHVAAGAVTAPLAFGGIDGAVQAWFQDVDPLGGRGVARFMLDAGFYSPLVIGLGFYAGGLIAGEEELATAGSAVTQAIVLTAVSTLVLKRLTDRGAPYRDGVAPEPGVSQDNAPIRIRRSGDPEDFRGDPDEYEDGIMWPSGHTSSHFAIAAALTAFYPDEPWIAAVTYPIALLMGLYMIEGDFHWLSDVIAGALIGHVIGWVVGANFREEFDARDPTHGAIEVLRAPLTWSVGGPIDL